jgi:hypothetical protein
MVVKEEATSDLRVQWGAYVRGMDDETLWRGYKMRMDSGFGADTPRAIIVAVLREELQRRGWL